MKTYPPEHYDNDEQLRQMVSTLKIEKELCHDHLITVINYYHGK